MGRLEFRRLNTKFLIFLLVITNIYSLLGSGFLAQQEKASKEIDDILIGDSELAEASEIHQRNKIKLLSKPGSFSKADPNDDIFAIKIHPEGSPFDGKIGPPLDIVRPEERKLILSSRKNDENNSTSTSTGAAENETEHNENKTEASQAGSGAGSGAVSSAESGAASASSNGSQTPSKNESSGADNYFLDNDPEKDEAKLIRPRINYRDGFKTLKINPKNLPPEIDEPLESNIVFVNDDKNLNKRRFKNLEDTANKLEIKSEIKAKLNTKLKMMVKQFEQSCESDLGDENLRSVCALCEATEAYNLNPENWFKIGLTHNHRSSYSRILERLSSLIPMNNITVAFGPDSICLAAVNGQEYTGRSSRDFLPECFVFNIDEKVLPTSLLLKYEIVSEDDGSYKEFQFRFKSASRFQMNSNILLIASSFSINKKNLSVEIDGNLTFDESLSLPFTIQYGIASPKSDKIIISLNDLKNQVSFQKIIQKMFGVEQSLSITAQLNFKRGLIEFGKLPANNVSLELYMCSKNRAQFNIKVISNDVPDFSISPEFNLKNCSAQGLVLAHQASERVNVVWNYHMLCNVEGLEGFASAELSRFNNEEHYKIKIKGNSSAAELFEKVFKGRLDINGEQAVSFSEEIKEFPTLGTIYQMPLLDPKFEFYPDPEEYYVLSGELFLPDSTVKGEMTTIINNIGGRLNPLTEINFKKTSLDRLFFVLGGAKASGQIKDFSDSISMNSCILRASLKDQDQFNSDVIKSLNFSSLIRGAQLLINFTYEDQAVSSNKLLSFLVSKVGRDYRFSMNGQLNDINGALHLVTGLSDLELAHNLEFKSPKLNIRVNGESDSPDIFIGGDYLLSVSDYFNLLFEGSISWKNLNENGILSGRTEESLKNLLNISDIQLNQINMIGRINSANSLDLFELTGLALYGYECYQTLNETASGEDQKKKACYFGNFDLKGLIGSRDFELLIYFKQMSIVHLLKSLLGYNKDLDLFERVNKNILNINLQPGVEFSFKTSVKAPGGSPINYPPGVTIKANAIILGLSGNLLMNFTPASQSLLGVFHFETFEFGGGNVVAFETHSENSNNILLAIEPGLEPDEQVNIEAIVFVFGVAARTNITAKADSLNFRLNQQVFRSKHNYSLDFTALNANNLKSATFNVRAQASESLKQALKDYLISKTQRWISDVRKFIQKLDAKMADLEYLVNKKREDLCDENLCPKVISCNASPSEQCIKYKTSEVCKKEEVFCIKPKQTCENETKTCVKTEDVCVKMSNELNEDGSTKCLEYKSNCVDYITSCSRWKHSCSNETVSICTSYEMQTDKEHCEQTAFICKTSENLEEVCVSKCKEKRNFLEKYEKVLELFTKSRNTLGEKLLGFWSLYQQVSKHPADFLQVKEISFEASLSAVIDVNTIEFKILVHDFYDMEAFTEPSVFSVSGYNFLDDSLLGKLLFDKLSKSWAVKFDFDAGLFDENESVMMKQLLGAYNTFSEAKEAELGLSLIVQENFQALDAFRQDGRKPYDLRKVTCKLGIDHSSDGSAYLKMGLTEVLCMIKGPFPSPKESKGDFLHAEYIVAPFSGVDRRNVSKFDKDWSDFAENLRISFEKVIHKEVYNRSQIQVIVTLLQSDGGHKSAIFNVITLALIDAGIALKEFLVSATVGVLNNKNIIDMTYEEQNKATCELTVSYLSRSEKIDFMEMKCVKINKADSESLLKLAVEASKSVYDIIRAFVLEESLKKYLYSR